MSVKSLEWRRTRFKHILPSFLSFYLQIMQNFKLNIPFQPDIFPLYFSLPLHAFFIFLSVLPCSRFLPLRCAPLFQWVIRLQSVTERRCCPQRDGEQRSLYNLIDVNSCWQQRAHYGHTLGLYTDVQRYIQLMRVHPDVCLCEETPDENRVMVTGVLMCVSLLGGDDL